MPAPSSLRKDLRSGRPPGPSAGGSCPSSSTPSGSDFPGFSFGFFLVVSGLPRREEPGSRRGRPSASARRHSRYSGDLTKRA